MIKVSSCSETGLKRQENQDAVLACYKEASGLFLVADGMGGHYRGEIASGIASEKLKNWWLSIEKCIEAMVFQDVAFALEKEVQRINRGIWQEYEKLGAQGGTTLCLLLVCKNAYAVMNVGDSRLYRCKGRLFEKMTTDDIWENRRHIQDTAALGNDSRLGKLTKALGFGEEVSPSFRMGELNEENCFLLCSDGVYKYCSEKAIKKNLKQVLWLGNTDKAMENIKKTVYRGGAGDNLSMVIVSVK